MKKTTKETRKDRKLWADPMCYPVFTAKYRTSRKPTPRQLVTFPVLKAPARFGRGPLFFRVLRAAKIVSFF